MFKGFYNLTSGVITHQQNLNVIANNMMNISTPGYKQDIYTATTFKEAMYSRVGNQSGEGPEIGNQSYIRAVSDIVTDFKEGIVENTDYALDFAIRGEGFFAVENNAGQVSYTRNGNFSLDDQGYLCLPGVGYVLNAQGGRIHLGTDQISGDSQGFIYNSTGAQLGQLGVYTFAEGTELKRNAQGLFEGTGAVLAQGSEVLNKYVERSNTDMVKQMSDMITYQRSLQSATQVIKMYDSIMSKASNEVGRL